MKISVFHFFAVWFSSRSELPPDFSIFTIQNKNSKLCHHLSQQHVSVSFEATLSSHGDNHFARGLPILNEVEGFIHLEKKIVQFVIWWAPSVALVCCGNKRRPNVQADGMWRSLDSNPTRAKHVKFEQFQEGKLGEHQRKCVSRNFPCVSLLRKGWTFYSTSSAANESSGTVFLNEQATRWLTSEINPRWNATTSKILRPTATNFAAKINAHVGSFRIVITHVGLSCWHRHKRLPVQVGMSWKCKDVFVHSPSPSLLPRLTPGSTTAAKWATPWQWWRWYNRKFNHTKARKSFNHRTMNPLDRVALKRC